MSHFYGDLRSSKGVSTRCGTKDGLTTHIRSYSFGISVECYYDKDKNEDIFTVYHTDGDVCTMNHKQLYEFRQPHTEVL